jgi:predicted acylesterase/phospholipase RssA
MIQNIVINGGGPTVFNVYGALRESHNQGLWNHTDVTDYYGTSAGAIMAIMMVLEYTWEELDDYIIKRPWQTVWNFNVLRIYEYYVNKGIFGPELFVELLGPLLRGKDFSVDTTLLELHNVTGKTVHLYSIELSSFTLKELSHITYPNMKIVDAVHASAALPILFQPLKYEGSYYTDGGIMLNYPLCMCDDKDPETVLGIKNVYSGSNANVHSVQGIFEYLSYILNMVIEKIQTRPTRTIKYELLIDTDFIDYSSIIRLSNSPEDRKALIDKGANNVVKLISQNPPSSPL